MTKSEVGNFNVINLAFVGDAVYSLYIRQKLLSECELKPNDMNKLTAERVCAEAQSELAETLLPLMTEEESDIFRRARNAKKNTRPKHAKVSEYNNSTGIEAVFGYLYLIGNRERLEFLLEKSAEN